jgi:hypothetical protein
MISSTLKSKIKIDSDENMIKFSEFLWRRNYRGFELFRAVSQQNRRLKLYIRLAISWHTPNLISQIFVTIELRYVKVKANITKKSMNDRETHAKWNMNMKMIPNQESKTG